MRKIITVLLLCCHIMFGYAQERYDLTAINKLLSTISPERYLDTSKDIFEFGFTLIQGSNHSDSCLVNLRGETVLDINDFNSKDLEAFHHAVAQEIVKANPSFSEIASDEEYSKIIDENISIYEQCIKKTADGKGTYNCNITNKEGKVVLTLNNMGEDDISFCDSSKPFVEIKKMDKYGLFNIDTGKYVFPCDFDYILEFWDATPEYKLTFYDGEWPRERYRYKLIKPSQFYVLVRKGDLSGVFNVESGKQILPCEYDVIDFIRFDNTPNWVDYIFEARKNGTYVYFTKDGEKLFTSKDKIEEIDWVSHHKPLFRQKGDSYYQLNGEMVIPAGNYRDVGAIGDYYFAASHDETSVSFFYNGKQISNQQLFQEEKEMRNTNSIPLCPSPKISLNNSAIKINGANAGMYELFNEMGKKVFPYPFLVGDIILGFGLSLSEYCPCLVNSNGYLMLPYFNEKKEKISEDYDFVNGMRYLIIDTKTGSIGNLSEK